MAREVAAGDPRVNFKLKLAICDTKTYGKLTRFEMEEISRIPRFRFDD